MGRKIEDLQGRIILKSVEILIDLWDKAAQRLILFDHLENHKNYRKSEHDIKRAPHFSRKVFRSDEHSASYADDARAETRVGRHVKCPVLLFCFNQPWNVQ